MIVNTDKPDGTQTWRNSTIIKPWSTVTLIDAELPTNKVFHLISLGVKIGGSWCNLRAYKNLTELVWESEVIGSQAAHTSVMLADATTFRLDVESMTEVECPVEVDVVVTTFHEPDAIERLAEVADE